MALVGVVIPARNEERTIRRLLDALGDLAGEAEIAVVCNGCTDETAAVVREAAPWADVIELDEGSKPSALRAGDATVAAMPRLYLDADVVLTAHAVRRLAAILVGDRLMAVAPTPRYDIGGASRVVRSHYRIWTALQSTSNAIAGTGAMMVSAAGRSRFGQWPDVIADDYYLDGLFHPEEKRRLLDVEVVVVLPRRLRDCVSRRARVHQGNRDVVRAGLRPPHGSDGRPGAKLIDLMRANPAIALHLPAHLVITISTRVLSAWRRRRTTAPKFYQDTSTR